MTPVPVDQIDRRATADGVNEGNGRAVGREDRVVVARLKRARDGGGQEQHDAPEENRDKLHDLTVRPAYVDKRWALLGIRGGHSGSSV